MNILERIIAFKTGEISQLKQITGIRELENNELFERKTLSMSNFLQHPEKTGIIAEFKRRSPSRGLINDFSGVEEVTTGYFRSGASALSILTDKEFFGGSSQDLVRARELNPIPILRKDFVIDKYQIAEAKVLGADAILLIAAALNKEIIENLAEYAHSIDLQVLLEIHNEAELEMINKNIDMVGVNNRDLKTFIVDIETSFQLSPKIPDGFTKISESGISSPLVIKQLRTAGFQGFLIGENFMRSPDPVQAFSNFVNFLY